jgi:hypothetical protein
MKEEQHGRVGKVREKMNEKVNVIKIDSIVIYPSIGRGPYIYRVGRSRPARKSFYKPNLSGLLNLARNRRAPVRPVVGTGQTGAPGVQILQKSYLPHPDSDLDVPHINLDLLNET